MRHCKRCGGTNVQEVMWVRVNTSVVDSGGIERAEISDYYGEDDDTTWCEDCDDHTGTTDTADCGKGCGDCAACFKANEDPTPYCSACGARSAASCDCPPLAAND